MSDIQKIVPSKLENAMYGILYKYVGEKIPEGVTPNQITLLGALFGLGGIICGAMAGISRFFLAGTITGVIGHLVCDDLDGYIARKRKMTSLAGGYFDLLTDILHITFLIIALSLSKVVNVNVAIWLAPVYALMMFTSMNSILYLKKFPFPKLGPIETHLFFIAIAILTMIFGTEPVISFKAFSKDYGFNFADLIFIFGGIPMYYEMIRLQIELFKDLQKEDRK